MPRIANLHIRGTMDLNDGTTHTTLTGLKTHTIMQPLLIRCFLLQLRLFGSSYL